MTDVVQWMKHVTKNHKHLSYSVSYSFAPTMNRHIITSIHTAFWIVWMPLGCATVGSNGNGTKREIKIFANISVRSPFFMTCCFNNNDNGNNKRIDGATQKTNNFQILFSFKWNGKNRCRVRDETRHMWKCIKYYEVLKTHFQMCKNVCSMSHVFVTYYYHCQSWWYVAHTRTPILTLHFVTFVVDCDMCFYDSEMWCFWSTKISSNWIYVDLFIVKSCKQSTLGRL